jgi:hypothetical protein
MKNIKLKNGIIIKPKNKIDEYDYDYPPLQEVCDVKNACDICPDEIRKPCCYDRLTGESNFMGNNEFDCQIYGMFGGFYCNEDWFLDTIKRCGVR